MQKNKPIGHIIPHTHWDREWRYPLWQTRMMLVEFFDELLNILENNLDYKTFLLDGQSVIVEDYLQIRPQNTVKIKKYISEGRLTIGPWYTLPDLYPVDGESLIRNLIKGIRVSDSFGGHLNIGYTSFGWEQTAQFPQIFKGFGIDFVATAKYLSPKRCPESEFLWESPDGTRALTTKLGSGGRHNLFINGYIPIMHGVYNNSTEYKLDWQEADLIYHEADEENYHKDYFKHRNTGKIHKELIAESMQTAWNNTDSTLVKTDRLLLAGCDFTSPLSSITDIIKLANEAFEDKEFKMSTLNEYAEEVKKKIDYSVLRVIKGELRDGPSIASTGNALQTRSYLKRMNKKAQNKLFHNAEVLSIMSSLVGGSYQKEFLDLAMEYLLKSHAHDSINGVTQDKTAEDVSYRLSQVLELSEIVSNQACSEIIGAIDTSEFNEKDILFVVINPTQYTRSEVVKVWLDIPEELNAWDFDIVDCNGYRMKIQHVSRKEDMVPVNDLNARPWPFKMVRHCTYVYVQDIPAFGYMVYKIIPTTQVEQIWINPTAMRTNSGNDIVKSANVMENERLKVKVNNNGTIQIVDKFNEKTYDNLNYFEDTGECGDYWTFYDLYNNKTYNSQGCNADIWIEDNGPLSATIAVKFTMDLPQYSIIPIKGYQGESRRSDETRSVNITVHYTLKRDSKKVDVRVKIKNTVEDHRMRVLFDTGINSEFSYASGHFTVDRRPVKPLKEADNNEYYPEMQTLPMQHFVDINNNKNGFALVNNCMSEFEAMDNDEGTI